EQNEPLQGAVIKIKGTTKSTVTNDKGYFTITITKQEAQQNSLIVTYIGYNNYETKINNKSSITVELSKNIKELNAVVVTNSYSKPKRKEEVIGSIATVSASELQTARPIESFDKMLEGLAAGVQVEPSTELGTPVKINIRGQNSLTNLFGGNDRALATTSFQPLFIVDGVPILEQRKGDEPTLLSNEQYLNPLANLNPDDIESISILKDAAAAAIYGANASNGVIIITTKKGRVGKTRMNVGYSNGWSQSINKLKWLNGYQYHELLRETYINDGRSPFDAELLAGASNISTPWFELTNRYATVQNLDFDLSGGNENTQFRLSASYLNQQAIQKGNDYEKIYFRLRIDHQLAKKLMLSVTMAPTLTKKNGVNVFSNVPIIPNVPAYNADGSFYKLSSLGVPNPLAVMAQNVDQHNGGSFNGNMRLEYAIKKNLRIATTLGTDALINKQNTFDSPKNATGESKGGHAQIFDRTTFSWINSTQINWSPTIKNIHKIDATVGFEARSEQVKLLTGTGSGFTYYRLNELSNASTRNTASSKEGNSSYSIYGQALYNLKGKYNVSISGRYDASSIFGTDVNATVNAAAGFGWIISNEKWFSKVTWLDMFRFRYSYGSTGNSRIGSAEARGIYTFNNTGYNDVVSADLGTPPNPFLSWEKSYKSNAGLDINFLKRFNFSLDYYTNIVDDAISLVNIRPETGFTGVLANIAKMRNRGIDASINAQIFTGKFTWSSTLNFGYNRNVVLEVKNNTERYSASEGASVLKTGISTTAIWGFKFAGIDPQTGVETYYDKEGKVVNVRQLDRNVANAYYLGDALPDAQGGFINTFGYKGLSVSIILNYSFGAEKLISYTRENNGRNLQNSNQSINLLDRWQKPGDIATVPRLSTGISGLGNPLIPNSTRYLYND
ncbi:MAG: SusC/RagA family TonB-linked outer membrane protein, partial [Chitinophagaceae bacterium]